METQKAVPDTDEVEIRTDIAETLSSVCSFSGIYMCLFTVGLDCSRNLKGTNPIRTSLHHQFVSLGPREEREMQGFSTLDCEILEARNWF